jgi:hypothetical protein
MEASVAAKVSCPAPGCDYGENGSPATFRAATMTRALKDRDNHLRSAHPGYKPPRGSMQDRVPRLD